MKNIKTRALVRAGKTKARKDKDPNTEIPSQPPMKPNFIRASLCPSTLMSDCQWAVIGHPEQGQSKYICKETRHSYVEQYKYDTLIHCDKTMDYRNTISSKMIEMSKIQVTSWCFSIIFVRVVMMMM